MEAVEASPTVRAAQSAQQGGDARKQFEIDDGVDSLAPGPAQEGKRIADERENRTVGDGENVLRRERAQQLQEHLGGQLHARLAYHRSGKDRRSHFRQFDKQNSPHRPRRAGSKQADEAQQ